MRLTDLNATFIGGWHPVDADHDYEGYRHLDSVEGAQGVFFQCPKCATGKPVEEENGERFVRGVHGIICWFANPRNASRVPDHVDPKPGRWYFEGDSLDTLTFTGPGSFSVLLTSGCGWHGFVKHGDAT